MPPQLAANPLAVASEIKRVDDSTLCVTSYQYNKNGQQISVTDGENNTTTTVYDVLGRPVETIDAEGRSVTTVYDLADRRIALIDGNGNTHTFVHDALGREIENIDPLGRSTYFGYDLVGNPTEKTNARGQTITMTYDLANRLIGEQFPDGTSHTYTYDAVGNRTGIEDENGTYTITYDLRNNPLTVTNPDDKTITYTYDALGRRATMTDPDDGVFTYTYDLADQLVELVNPQDQTTTITYDLLGRVTKKELDNGAVTSMTYDEGGRLTVLENRKSDDSEVNVFTYTYDCVGNRLSVEETNGDVTTWTYDKTYQLTREQRSGSNSYDVTYTYDGAGNRLTQVDSGATTTYTYDAANQLLTAEDSSGVTTYTYDADGNRTERETPSATTYYTWDEQNRLTEAEPPAGAVTLTYNPDGQRVQRESTSDTKKFIYDFKNVLQESDDSDVTQQCYTSTTAEYGHLISEYDGSGTAFHQYDALGTTDALLDEAETATDRYAHRAFGLEQSHTGSSASPYTFVGQQHYYRDDQLDLYLLGMGNSDAGGRHYDPTTGAFLSKDPSGYEDDDNLYRYVNNNPVNAIDPSGHGYFNAQKRAAREVWAWRSGERTDEEFRDAYLMAKDAADPAVKFAESMLSAQELAYLNRLIREKSAPARRRLSPEEHARRLAEKYDRRPVATVRPWTEDDAALLPEPPPAWVQDSPSPGDIDDGASEVLVADPGPSIGQKIEETRALIRDAQERIEGVRSLNATVIASIQRSESSYLNACYRRHRHRLAQLLQQAKEADIDSEEFRAAIKERREIHESCAAEAKRLFAGNRESVKSITAEHRAEESEIQREMEAAQDLLAELEERLDSGEPLTADFRSDEEKAARGEQVDEILEDWAEGAAEVGTEYALAFVPIPPPLKLGAARLAGRLTPAPVRQFIKTGAAKGKSAVTGAFSKAKEGVKSAFGKLFRKRATKRVAIPGDADFIGPIQRGWRLTPEGMGAHMVERVNVRGRPALSALDQAGTPRFYPRGTPENAGAAHVRLHQATRDAGIRLRQGQNAGLSDAELLQRYRQAYSDARLQGIRGDLRTPDGSTVIARDVTPAEAIEGLLKWANLP